MKKAIIVLAALVLLSGCVAQQAAPTQPPQAVTMRFITPAQVLQYLEDGESSYVLLDVRSAEDYAEGHLKGTVSAPVTHGENADDETSLANLKAALLAETGSEMGDGRALLIVCYKGGAFAQKAYDLLVEQGFPADALITLEGGMQAWRASGESYTAWLEP